MNVKQILACYSAIENLSVLTNLFCSHDQFAAFLFRFVHKIKNAHLISASDNFPHICFAFSNEIERCGAININNFKFDELLDLENEVHSECLEEIGVQVIFDDFCSTLFEPFMSLRVLEIKDHLGIAFGKSVKVTKRST